MRYSAIVPSSTPKKLVIMTSSPWSTAVTRTTSTSSTRSEVSAGPRTSTSPSAPQEGERGLCQLLHLRSPPARKRSPRTRLLRSPNPETARRVRTCCLTRTPLASYQYGATNPLRRSVTLRALDRRKLATPRQVLQNSSIVAQKDHDALAMHRCSGKGDFEPHHA